MLGILQLQCLSGNELKLRRNEVSIDHVPIAALHPARHAAEGQEALAAVNGPLLERPVLFGNEALNMRKDGCFPTFALHVDHL